MEAMLVSSQLVLDPPRQNFESRGCFGILTWELPASSTARKPA